VKINTKTVLTHKVHIVQEIHIQKRHVTFTDLW